MKPALTEQEKLAISDETGVHSLEDLVGDANGEEPWIRHVPHSFNRDTGTATMMCGLTKAIGVSMARGEGPSKWRWCPTCKRYA